MSDPDELSPWEASKRTWGIRLIRLSVVLLLLAFIRYRNEGDDLDSVVTAFGVFEEEANHTGSFVQGGIAVVLFLAGMILVASVGQASRRQDER